MNAADTPLTRAKLFCDTYGLRIPILMAPMAGACPPELASAVGNAGGMGACGTLMMQPADIAAWVSKVRASTNGAFQLNTWIPDPEPIRDSDHESKVREFLGEWGPQVSASSAESPLPDFNDQCQAMIDANPRIISSIMGLYPEQMVQQMKAEGIHWFATATTVTEALEAQSAGADVIVAQGMEAGGHRGSFNADDAETALVGLFSLLPAIVDAVEVPVVATGGIADPRGVAAAMILGASAVQIGTGLLRATEAGTAQPWADAIVDARPEDTIATRAFSGRLGRSLRTGFAVAAANPDVPEPAPYPIQRNLTSAMRAEGAKANDLNRMQAWAGQSASYARAASAADIVQDLWESAQAHLPQG